MPRATPTCVSPAVSRIDASFSLLLSLPRELRDRVYHYALRSAVPFRYPNPRATPPRHDVALGLLMTSRQVYAEAAPVLYAGNRFLFTHPSDITMFRVVASPAHSALLAAVYLRVHEKDVRLWTAYLSSKKEERSLKHDLPHLKALCIFFTYAQPLGPLAALANNMAVPPQVVAQVHAVQHILGQQIQSLNQQLQNMAQMLMAQQTLNVAAMAAQHPALQAPQTGPQDGAGDANATQAAPTLPPPTPTIHPTLPLTLTQALLTPLTAGPADANPHAHHHPPPGQPHAHGTQNNPPPNPSPLSVLAQQHVNLFPLAFGRWEREMGIELLCGALQETRPADAKVRIVCIMRLPRPEVVRMCRIFPDELTVDRNGDARTKFRNFKGIEISLEINGIDVGAARAAGAAA